MTKTFNLIYKPRNHNIMKRGLFIGRFQPFHKGHLNDVKAALKEVDELIIAIGSSQESNTKKNAFSADERKNMIELALKKENITNYNIFNIPDFNDDVKWLEFIKSNLPTFDIIFMSDKNTTGEKWVESCFKDKFPIKKIHALKNISSTTIREFIIDNKPWNKLVTEEVAFYINKINGIKKIKDIG